MGMSQREFSFIKKRLETGDRKVVQGRVYKDRIRLPVDELAGDEVEADERYIPQGKHVFCKLVEGKIVYFDYKTDEPITPARPEGVKT